MSWQNQAKLDLTGQRTTVTVAEERVFHYIADEELEMLIRGESDTMAQIFWASVGAFIGALQPAVVSSAKVGAVPLAWADLIPIIVALAALPVALVAGLTWRSRYRQVQSMQARIRERHKVPVGQTLYIDELPMMPSDPEAA